MMFTFWYPGSFIAQKKNFQNQIKKNQRNSIAYSRVPKDIAENFIRSIDLLIHLNFWTPDKNKIVDLLDQVSICYIDQDYRKIEALQNIVNDIFDTTLKKQLDLHFMQYTCCTLLGLFVLINNGKLPLLHLYALIQGLSGLYTNYLIRHENVYQNIRQFIDSLNNISNIEKNYENQQHFLA
jgi:hypothetical protein